MGVYGKTSTTGIVVKVSRSVRDPGPARGGTA